MPRTSLGKWAGGLMVAFLVFLIAVILGRNLLGIQPGTPSIVIVGIGMAITGLATFVTAVVSLFKFKDRSFVVILATILGFLATLIFILELVEGIAWRLTH
jgi:hypothetical protein